MTLGRWGILGSRRVWRSGRIRRQPRPRRRLRRPELRPREPLGQLALRVRRPAATRLARPRHLAQAGSRSTRRRFDLGDRPSTTWVRDRHRPARRSRSRSPEPAPVYRRRDGRRTRGRADPEPWCGIRNLSPVTIRKVWPVHDRPPHLGLGSWRVPPEALLGDCRHDPIPPPLALGELVFQARHRGTAPWLGALGRGGRRGRPIALVGTGARGRRSARWRRVGQIGPHEPLRELDRPLVS